MGGRGNDHDMTANEFRKMALGFPGTVESAHMSHPDFRVEGRIFATLGYPDDSCGMVKLTVEQQRTFIKRGEGAFRPCNGVWGERGATNVHLASVKKNLLKSALRAAIGNALANAKSKRPTKLRPMQTERI
jgi:hypothetical protein